MSLVKNLTYVFIMGLAISCSSLQQSKRNVASKERMGVFLNHGKLSENCNNFKDILPFLKVVLKDDNAENLIKTYESDFKHFLNTGNLHISPEKNHNLNVLECVGLTEGILMGGFYIRHKRDSDEFLKLVDDTIGMGESIRSNSIFEKGEQKVAACKSHLDISDSYFFAIDVMESANFLGEDVNKLEVFSQGARERGLKEQDIQAVWNRLRENLDHMRDTGRYPVSRQKEFDSEVIQCRSFIEGVYIGIMSDKVLYAIENFVKEGILGEQKISDSTEILGKKIFFDGIRKLEPVPAP